MDNVLYFHPRCSYSRDLIDRVRRLPRLAATIRPVDVSTRRPRHRIAQVPCVVYEGRLYQGRDAFRWLSAQATRCSATEPDPELAAAECSSYPEASTLRFVDFNADRPTATMAPEAFCEFRTPT